MGHMVVAVVDSGEAAIVQADKFRPDLVLMDIKLAGEIDGIAAAEEIFTRFQTPMVYLSAYGDEQTMRRANATRACGYLKKPFTGAELQDMVEMALLKYSSTPNER